MDLINNNNENNGIVKTCSKSIRTIHLCNYSHIYDIAFCVLYKYVGTYREHNWDFWDLIKQSSVSITQNGNIKSS